MSHRLQRNLRRLLGPIVIAALFATAFIALARPAHAGASPATPAIAALR